MAGAPEGNRNGAKGKLFYDQLRKALVQEDALRLRKIAEVLVTKAEEGEAWAVKEVMDRVDGKAVQSNEISGADGQALSGLQVVFIDGKSES
jgi:hypothetical protein